MDTDSYILKRIGTAKIIGLVIGLIGFFMIPALWPEEGMRLRIGILLWYTTFGVFIGILGMFDHHPLLKFQMPCWFRGIVFGAWLNLVLAFLMYDKLSLLMQQLEGAFSGIESPFWIVLEGAVVGLIIDAATTKYAGEGLPETSRLTD
ncbi:MAG: hypothetical protein ABFS42_06790 [Candidatus Krumholzibacteriota bacterium]